ncbi:hypothetical protein K2173_026909 [Erythroxylum novogranatense]|uniref:DYW domain-containing protein n=1 Tax=Erythroxylum novogranatense TaxID=1862640 RepID=A0AAV8TXJ0_9ROSI|nr:hypothetical protein K2173_026909 [Erythroxylum novogranatense]
MCAHTFQSLLSKALSSSTNLSQLYKAHTLLITSGLAKSVFFSGKTISKYAELKRPISSLLVFRQTSTTSSIYLWNSIIRALIHNGMFTKALEFYFQMRETDLKPDRYTFPSVINACASIFDFEKGRIIHEHVLESSCGSDLYIGNALVDMYARFGDLAKARKVFEEIPHKDTVSWNTLMSGYSANGYWEEALEIYHQSKMDGLKPDCFTFSCILPACGGLNVIDEGKVIHGLVEKTGVNADVVVSNGLLSMYFKFERLEDAQRVFDKMVIRDNMSWNSLICGYFNMGFFEESIELFKRVVNRFKPDMLTITSLLRACSHSCDLINGKFIHDYMVKSNFAFDIRVYNILIDTYVKCGDMLAAKEVFDTMRIWDTVSWNSLINGYILNGGYGEGVRLFKMMKIGLKPDYITYVILLSTCSQLADTNFGSQVHCEITKLGVDSYLIVANALVNMYGKCGRLDCVLQVFENTKVRDVVMWNTIIAACVRGEDCILGFRMINRMRTEELMPDKTTMLCILHMCCLLAAKRLGKEIHACILKLGFESSVTIGNALIEMYSKCGDLMKSTLVFNRMKSKDVVTWTSLISAYGMYGEGKKAIRAFHEMEAVGIVPDHVAFVSLIYACSHSGLVEEGLACFAQLEKNCNMKPRLEHYASIVDLLSRSKLLSKAEEFISSMPLKPDASIWGTLLSACRGSDDLKIAERAAQNIIQLGTENTGYYVLASNVYAALGKWEQATIIRKLIQDRGLKKDPGCSWIELRNRLYTFGSRDKLFEQHEKVNQLLGTLARLMTEKGYISELQYDLHDVEDDEKRDMLFGHSERIAIAFGLLNTEPGTPLTVMKNLRVCVDCHTWTKHISNIVRREILVRDANRFHLFRHGSCSCGDHW